MRVPDRLHGVGPADPVVLTGATSDWRKTPRLAAACQTSDSRSPSQFRHEVLADCCRATHHLRLGAPDLPDGCSNDMEEANR